MFESDILTTIFSPFTVVVTGVVTTLIVAYLIAKMMGDRKKIEEFLEKEYIILSILVPKDNDKKPLSAEQMFASLHGILRPSEEVQKHISFEIASQDKFTQFFVCTPKNLKDFVESQIYAQYPTVEIREVSDYTDVNIDEMKAVGTELVLSREDVYPIKTFPSFEVDPLAGITAALSKVEGQERVWIQVLARPVGDSWQDRGVKVVKATREGVKLDMKFTDGFVKQLSDGFIDIGKSIIPTLINPDQKPADARGGSKELRLSAPQETAMKGIETKVQKLGFEVKIRIMVISTDQETAKSKLLGVVGAFRQFNTTNLNSFAIGNVVEGSELLPVFQLRPFGEKGYIFNIEELASIYHFPHVSVETPSIVWAGSKKAEPPANLPVREVVQDDEMTIIGKANFRHYEQIFGMKLKDRRLHTYCIGKTGTGKSTIMENMIYDDIVHGRGIAVVDPHGQTIEHIMNFIPEERLKDVVYLNPADRDFPIGFNLLENVNPDQKGIIASGLMSVFTKLWANVWSARMEYILRNTILALLEYPNATMLGIMRVLNDKQYRKKVLSYVKDPVILDFFLNEYEKYDPKFRTEAIAPIQNKVGQFLSSSTIRNILGQQKSTINIREIMDSGKILLIDLAVGKIGEDNSTLLGSMLITKVQLAAMQRADVSEDQRKDFYLYVDEFQNFATDSFAVILSEARKYHLNLILTNQYTAQVPEVVMDAIIGNVGTIIAFRVGSPDAKTLEKEFAPVFDANDMVNQPNYHIYIKMAIDGVTCPAFSAATLAPKSVTKSFKAEAIEISRKVYSRPRAEVEKEITNSALGEAEEADKPKVKQRNGGVPEPVWFESFQDAKGVHWYIIDNETVAKYAQDLDEYILKKNSEGIKAGEREGQKIDEEIVVEGSEEGQEVDREKPETIFEDEKDTETVVSEDGGESSMPGEVPKFENERRLVFDSGNENSVSDNVIIPQYSEEMTLITKEDFEEYSIVSAKDAHLIAQGEQEASFGDEDILVDGDTMILEEGQTIKLQD